MKAEFQGQAADMFRKPLDMCVEGLDLARDPEQAGGLEHRVPENELIHAIPIRVEAGQQHRTRSRAKGRDAVNAQAKLLEPREDVRPIDLHTLGSEDPGRVNTRVAEVEQARFFPGVPNRDMGIVVREIPARAGGAKLIVARANGIALENQHHRAIVEPVEIHLRRNHLQRASIKCERLSRQVDRCRRLSQRHMRMGFRFNPETVRQGNDAGAVFFAQLALDIDGVWHIRVSFTSWVEWLAPVPA
mgnify:CR=1 FL=1